MKHYKDLLILFIQIVATLCIVIGTVWYVNFSGESSAVQLTSFGWVIQQSLHTYNAYEHKNKRDIIVHSLFLCFFLGMTIFTLFFLD